MSVSPTRDDVLSRAFLNQHILKRAKCPKCTNTLAYDGESNGTPRFKCGTGRGPGRHSTNAFSYCEFLLAATNSQSAPNKELITDLETFLSFMPKREDQKRRK